MNFKKPETWRDICKKLHSNAPVAKGHNWIITGGGGGTEARSWSPNFDRTAKPKHIKYKCLNCGATATKEIGGEFLLDKREYQDLTCKEVTIHDIIT